MIAIMHTPVLGSRLARGALIGAAVLAAVAAALVLTVPVPQAWLVIHITPVASSDRTRIMIGRSYHVAQSCASEPVRWVDMVDGQGRQLPSVLGEEPPDLSKEDWAFSVAWDASKPLPAKIRLRIQCSGLPAAMSDFVPIRVESLYGPP